MKSEKTKKLLYNEKVEDKPAIILQSNTDYVSLIEPCLADLWNFKVLSNPKSLIPCFILSKPKIPTFMNPN